MESKELAISHSFLDKIDAPIFAKNKSGIYTYCNTALSKLLGIPAKQILGNTAFEIAPQNLAIIYTESDKVLFATLKDQEYNTLVQKNNKHETSVTICKSVVYSNNEMAGYIATIEVHGDIGNSSLACLKKLSSREAEILHLLKQGASVKKIAKHLQISPHTVTDHLKSTYKKLGVNSKTEAIYKTLALIASDPL